MVECLAVSHKVSGSSPLSGTSFDEGFSQEGERERCGDDDDDEDDDDEGKERMRMTRRRRKRRT